MLLFEKYCAQTSLQQIIIFLVFFSLAQYAKKNGLLRNKGIRATIGVSVAVVLLIVVFIVYWLIMRKKKGMQSFSVLLSGHLLFTYFITSEQMSLHVFLNF